MILGMAAAAGASALPFGPSWAEEGGLTLDFVQAGEQGFLRTPVLLSGATDAILFDAGFTFPDGEAVVEAIKASGKTLKLIYISCSDPDYYFSLKPIHAAFPDVPIQSPSENIEKIKASVEGKIATWGPQLGAAGPQSPDDIVMPEANDAPSLTLEGQTIEIVPVADMVNRRYLWSPSLEAVFGGVLVFAGEHVWTADTATPELRTAWVAALDGILARNPKRVIPGHMTPGSATDASAVTFTRDYLVAFDQELAQHKDSASLIAAMTARYPDLGGAISLELGAKVATGEMTWG